MRRGKIEKGRKEGEEGKEGKRRNLTSMLLRGELRIHAGNREGRRINIFDLEKGKKRERNKVRFLKKNEITPPKKKLTSTPYFAKKSFQKRKALWGGVKATFPKGPKKTFWGGEEREGEGREGRKGKERKKGQCESR